MKRKRKEVGKESKEGGKGYRSGVRKRKRERERERGKEGEEKVSYSLHHTQSHSRPTKSPKTPLETDPLHLSLPSSLSSYLPSKVIDNKWSDQVGSRGANGSSR